MKRDAAAALASALLLALAYPPFHLFVPSFVCLVPVILALRNAERGRQPLRRHLFQGFYLGIFTTLAVHHWLLVGLWRFRPALSLAFPVAALAFGLGGALLIASTGWILRATAVPLWVAFPVLWTALEWLIGNLGALSFPWLGLGSSLTGFPAVIQIADVTGARGLTLLLAAANVALAQAWIDRRRPRRALVPIAATCAGLAIALGYGLFRMTTLTLRPAGTVVLVQPNVGYEQKWRPDLRDSIVVNTLLSSRRVARTRAPGLIVWPESALPLALELRPDWEGALASHARASGATVVAGGMSVRPGVDGAYHLTNAAFVFDPREGRRIGTYRKRKVTPVIERFNGVSAGTEQGVIPTRLGTLGLLICFEVAFEDLARAQRVAGANILVNVSNDGLLDGTTEPYQHAAHAVMRAIETRLTVARAANTGISGVVDPLGRWSARGAIGRPDVVTGNLLVSTEAPLYPELGDWVGRAAILAALLMLAAAGSSLIHIRVHVRTAQCEPTT